MVTVCPSCGNQRSGDADCCPNCGNAIAESLWEYTDMVVPLKLRSNDRDLAKHFDEVVRRHLHEAAQGGWHPSSPVDWGTLWGSGRVRRSTARSWYSALGIGRNAFTWESVTIRLKRTAQREAS